MRGRHWSSIGHYHKNQTYIYPEEALFLLDRGMLKITSSDDESSEYSIEEAYHLLIEKGHLSIELVQVYMHLKRLGYIVIRCDPLISLCSYKIYRPDSGFRKSSPGSPSFYLSIQRYSRMRRDQVYPHIQISYRIFNLDIQIPLSIYIKSYRCLRKLKESPSD